MEVRGDECADEVTESCQACSESVHVVLQPARARPSDESASSACSDLSFSTSENEKEHSRQVSAPSVSNFLVTIDSADVELVTGPYEQTSLKDKIRVRSTHRRLRMDEIFEKILKDVQGRKKLHESVCCGDADGVIALLNAGIKAGCPDDKGRTALHFAASKGNERMVKLLLDNGADPNKKDDNGNTPLHLAACTNHVPIVTLLLKAGTDVYSIDNRGFCPLDLAVSRLRLFREDLSTSASTLKIEIQQIIDMIRQYYERSGELRKAKQLEDINRKLMISQTRKEVDEVNDLLSSFTNLTIKPTTSTS